MKIKLIEHTNRFINNAAILRNPSQVFYGWWIAVVSGLVMVVATVPLFHAMSVWAVAVESQFGWSRLQLGAALAFTRVEGGIMGPVEGYLTDKFGTRRMVLIGMLICGCGWLLFSQVKNLWMFYVAYLIMAMGQGLGSWLPTMTVINHWFIKNRAMAMGVSNMISRAGALILVPGIAYLIDPEQSRLGWSLTAGIIGVTTLVLAFPISRLIRDRPSQYGLFPDGIENKTSLIVDSSQALGNALEDNSDDFTAMEAIKTPVFWFIAFGHGFTSMIILAMFSHLGLMIKDLGFSITTTGQIVSVYIFVALIFQLVGGYAGDHMPKNIALFIFSTIQAFSVLILLFAHSYGSLVLFGILFGMGFGGRNPLTVAIRGDYFGRNSFGKILGISTVPMNVLLLISPLMAGWIKDETGSYDMAILILAGFSMLGAIMFLISKKPIKPNKISTS
jgi:sugar phosphate permease